MSAEPLGALRADQLIVGQSHIAAIRQAERARRERHPDGPRARTLHTIQDRFGSELVDVAPDAAEPYAAARFAPVLEEEISAQLARGPRVVSVSGGNAHNVLGLVQYARPFDFLLPGEAAAALTSGAEPIAAALVEAALRRRLQHDFARLRLLREIAGPFVHVESPPPVGDEAVLSAQAETWFGIAGGTARAIAPRALRWRIWRLNSALFRREVEALGGRFLPVPPETQDADGFLRPELAGDATHGNQAYGTRVLAMLDALAPELPVAGPPPAAALPAQA
jgi:hypothetical protein